MRESITFQIGKFIAMPGRGKCMNSAVDKLIPTSRDRDRTANLENHQDQWGRQQRLLGTVSELCVK